MAGDSWKLRCTAAPLAPPVVDHMKEVYVLKTQRELWLLIRSIPIMSNLFLGCIAYPL